jgi:hypothetical protein
LVEDGEELDAEEALEATTEELELELDVCLLTRDAVEVEDFLTDDVVVFARRTYCFEEDGLPCGPQSI